MLQSSLKVYSVKNLLLTPFLLNLRIVDLFFFSYYLVSFIFPSLFLNLGLAKSVRFNDGILVSLLYLFCYLSFSYFSFNFFLFFLFFFLF